MPSVRFTRYSLLSFLLTSLTLKLLSRVSFMRWAMRSRAQSQDFSSNLSEPGARYITFCKRRSLTATWNNELPLEQRDPWLMGCWGSPSILITLPFLVWTRSPHPTAQNGQMVVEALSPLILVSGASALASPGLPERATPAVASAPPCRNCLLDIPMLNFSFRL